MPRFYITVEGLHILLRNKKVSDSINIALKKVHGQTISALQVKSDVNQLKGFICQIRHTCFTANSGYTSLLAKIYV